MTKAPKDEKICVVVTKTYEILEDESTRRRSSHDEGIEVEYHDADGAHVLGPTSPTGSPTGSTSMPRAALEAGTPMPPRPPRARVDTADTFPENASQPGGFHVGLLDRIVTFFNTGNGGRRGRRRQSSQQSLSASSSAANVLQRADLSLGELKKDSDKDDTTALPATRERTRTETTVQSSELESSTFEESSVSGHLSPRGRIDGDISGETGETSDSAASQPSGTGLTGLPSLDEE